VQAAQSGLRLIVDGTDRGPLPIELRDLPSGIHAVRVEGGERYEVFERAVELVPGKVADLGTLKLQVLKGHVTVDLATPGARVLLVNDGAPKSKVLGGPWPMRIEVDASGWSLIASKRGHQEFVHQLVFPEGQADLGVRVELTPVGSVAPAVRASAAVASSAPKVELPTPTSSDPPELRSVEELDESADDAAVDVASGMGVLSMNSVPLAKVLLDGRPLGSTPKVEVAVSAGAHTVTFIHPELGKKSVAVEVAAGGRASAAVRFEAKN